MDRGTIQRITEKCRLGEKMESSDGVAVAMALGGWLSGSFKTLDEAFGVKRTAGQRSNKIRANMAARDELIRQCAAQHYVGSNIAGDMARDLARYGAVNWLRDRHKVGMPAGYAGSRRAYFFLLFQRAGGRVPSGEKQLRRILSAGAGGHEWGAFRVPRGELNDSASTKSAGKSDDAHPNTSSGQSVAR